MPSVEETQSFSVSMETRGDIKSDYVFFQFVIQYSNVYQAVESDYCQTAHCG